MFGCSGIGHQTGPDTVFVRAEESKKTEDRTPYRCHSSSKVPSSLCPKSPGACELRGDSVQSSCCPAWQLGTETKRFRFGKLGFGGGLRTETLTVQGDGACTTVFSSYTQDTGSWQLPGFLPLYTSPPSPKLQRLRVESQPNSQDQASAQIPKP